MFGIILTSLALSTCASGYCIKNCYVDDVKYYGGHIKTISNIDNPIDCQKLCVDNNSCKYFAWDGDEKQCLLKRGKGSAPKANGWISGPKKCDDDDDDDDDNDDDDGDDDGDYKKFKKSDKLLNYAWSNTGRQEKTKYDKKLKVVLLDMDVDKSEVKYYKDRGHTVIGYISVGSVEKWRDDADSFSKRVVWKNMNGWKGEKWFRIKYWKDLKDPMKKRLIKLKQKGFDGYEGDNIGIYPDNKKNKKYNIEYAKWLAKTAHDLGLSAVMKNGNMDYNLAKEVVDDYDAIITEGGFYWKEIEAYKTYADKGKPIWAFEYKGKNRIKKHSWISSIWYDTKKGWKKIK